MRVCTREKLHIPFIISGKGIMSTGGGLEGGLEGGLGFGAPGKAPGRVGTDGCACGGVKLGVGGTQSHTHWEQKLLGSSHIVTKAGILCRGSMKMKIQIQFQFQ